MKRIAVLAILAIVVAMVPMTTASSQPTPGSLDGVGTLMVIHPGVPGIGQLDLWIEVETNEWEKFVLASPSQTELQIPDGSRRFQLCVNGGAPTTDQLCNSAVGPTPLGPIGPFPFEIDENDILNALINPVLFVPGFIDFQENDTEATETDEAKLTIFNNSGAQFDACVGNDHVISLAGAPIQPVPMQVAEFGAQDGETRDFKLYATALGNPFPGTCDPALATAVQALGFPPGSNTVVNFVGVFGGFCGDECGYQIFPGEEPPGSDQLVDAFCAVVLEAANITPWLQDLFDEVEVGNEDTYPDPEDVETVLVRIAELLELGNETAPDDIIDVWLRATAAFVETGRLAAVDYDIAELPQADIRDLVDGVEHPGEDDSEEAADTAAITAWVTTNCFGAIEAEPDFTG